MKAHFERFTIDLTKDQAASASHPGDCDADVKALLRVPRVRVAGADGATLRVEPAS